MTTRHRYIPIEDATVDMVLSAATTVVERGHLSLVLPAGHVLTDENLHQLKARFAEFVYVDEADTRDDAQIADDAAQAAYCVLRTFDGADLSDPNLAGLFDQVLGFRSE